MLPSACMSQLIIMEGMGAKFVACRWMLDLPTQHGSTKALREFWNPPAGIFFFLAQYLQKQLINNGGKTEKHTHPKAYAPTTGKTTFHPRPSIPVEFGTWTKDPLVPGPNSTDGGHRRRRLSRLVIPTITKSPIVSLITGRIVSDAVRGL